MQPLKPSQSGNVLVGVMMLVVISSILIAVVDQKITVAARVMEEMADEIQDMQWNEDPERVLDDEELCGTTNLMDGIGPVPFNPPNDTVLKTMRHDDPYPDYGVYMTDANGSVHWFRGAYMSTNAAGQQYGVEKIEIVTQGQQQAPGGPRLIRFLMRVYQLEVSGHTWTWEGEWGFLELDAAGMPVSCFSRIGPKAMCLLQGRVYDATLPYNQRCQP